MGLAPNPLPCQCRTPRDPRETLRKSDARSKIGISAKPEIIPEADGHDPDVVIREMSPVDEMALVAKEEPCDTELGRDGLRHDTMGDDLVEGCEQACDVFFGLVVAPFVARVAVDVIKAVGRPFLDTDGGHRIRPCSAQSPRLRSTVGTTPPGLRMRGSARPSAG